MLSKETFCEALRKIQAQKDRDEQFSKALTLMGDGHFVFEGGAPLLAALLDVLKEAVNDQYDYIIKEPHTPDRESCSFRQEGDVAMSSLEEKKSELERVLGVFQNYIEGSELLDVVYSKKFGYVLLGLPAADSIDDSDVTRLEDPETLVKEIYQNLAYDFMEQEGHSEDYTEATNLEKRAMREWMKEYTDQLPEYNYLLDELLG